ncbi:MAG TPA: Pr6Pr family membrane protein [Acidimicrobiia bacterium]|nr:Pr6Pr family membrane protein [Acidimicrobiia bacterium]
MNETVLRSVRLALASLITVALAAQLIIGLSRSGLSIVNFFSYFTVLSNTMAVVMLTMLAFRPDRDETRWFAIFRGAVTVYMSVTGLVYVTILAPNLADVGVPEPWIDWTIHILGPLAVILDWFFNPPPRRLDDNAIWIWLSFPALYLMYSLARGPIADWYPYPFLDPSQENGYAGVGLWSLIVGVVVLAFGFLYYWWVNRANKVVAEA